MGSLGRGAPQNGSYPSGESLPLLTIAKVTAASRGMGYPYFLACINRFADLLSESITSCGLCPDL